MILSCVSLDVLDVIPCVHPSREYLHQVDLCDDSRQRDSRVTSPSRLLLFSSYSKCRTT